jgi:hypothetical protein
VAATSESRSLGDSSAEAWNRMNRMVGHYAPWFFVAILGFLITLTLVPPVFAAVPWYVSILLLLVAVFLACCIFAHNRQLCERCIRSLPLDASTVASRHGVRFRVAHLFERKFFAVGYLAAILGSAFLYSHPVGRYAWAAAQASLAYLLLVYVTHQRLQPWCPHCRNGGQWTVPTTPSPVFSRF